MQLLIDWLRQYGLVMVLLNVFATQLGLPVPSYPILIAAGAWSLAGGASWSAILAVAMAAAVVADLGWYAAGRRAGSRVLRTLCRVSLSPDSCVRQTETVFTRYGTPSLMVAKFIPGFGAVATAVAGVVRANLTAFLLFDAIGAALWAGLAIYLGRVFHGAVNDLTNTLAQLGHWGLAVLLAALLVFLGFKWRSRRRLLEQLHMARITVDELLDLQREGTATVLVDVRSAQSQERDGVIPGAISLPAPPAAPLPSGLAHDAQVVVYCSCPNEASAAVAARRLMQAGFTRVRPLAGGVDSWVTAGQPLAQAAAQA